MSEGDSIIHNSFDSNSGDELPNKLNTWMVSEPQIKMKNSLEKKNTDMRNFASPDQLDSKKRFLF